MAHATELLDRVFHIEENIGARFADPAEADIVPLSLRDVARLRSQRMETSRPLRTHVAAKLVVIDLYVSAAREKRYRRNGQQKQELF